MKVLTCAAARRRLQAYHDQELPISDQIAVSAHVEWCDECAADLAALGCLRGALRTTLPGRAAFTADDADGLRGAVVSRMRAEQAASFAAEIREMFQDMHLVYAGVGAAAAAAVCVIVLVGMMRVAINEVPLAPQIQIARDTEAGTGASQAPGTNQNPMALDEGVRMPRAINEPFASMASDDAVFTLSAVLTREGRLEHLALVDAAQARPRERADNDKYMDKYMEELLGVASRARFEPARVAGAPVAVNMVWLFAHTTVRGGKAEIALPPTPAAKRRQAVVVPAPTEKPLTV
jgi:Putative zinc-finger